MNGRLRAALAGIAIALAGHSGAAGHNPGATVLRMGLYWTDATWPASRPTAAESREVSTSAAFAELEARVARRSLFAVLRVSDSNVAERYAHRDPGGRLGDVSADIDARAAEARVGWSEALWDALSAEASVGLSHERTKVDGIERRGPGADGRTVERPLPAGGLHPAYVGVGDIGGRTTAVAEFAVRVARRLHDHRIAVRATRWTTALTYEVAWYFGERVAVVPKIDLVRFDGVRYGVAASLGIRLDH